MTNRGYTQADWDEVSDNPELTTEEIASARPFAEVFPELAATIRERNPDGSEKTVRTSIHLSLEVAEHFRFGEDGFERRIDEALRKIAAAG